MRCLCCFVPLVPACPFGTRVTIIIIGISIEVAIGKIAHHAHKSNSHAELFAAWGRGGLRWDGVPRAFEAVQDLIKVFSSFSSCRAGPRQAQLLAASNSSAKSSVPAPVCGVGGCFLAVSLQGVC